MSLKLYILLQAIWNDSLSKMTPTTPAIRIRLSMGFANPFLCIKASFLQSFSSRIVELSGVRWPDGVNVYNVHIDV
jgi:hypothetical protein